MGWPTDGRARTVCGVAKEGCGSAVNRALRIQDVGEANWERGWLDGRERHSCRESLPACKPEQERTPAPGKRGVGRSVAARLGAPSTLR